MRFGKWLWKNEPNRKCANSRIWEFCSCGKARVLTPKCSRFLFSQNNPIIKYFGRSVLNTDGIMLCNYMVHERTRIVHFIAFGWYIPDDSAENDIGMASQSNISFCSNAVQCKKKHKRSAFLLISKAKRHCAALMRKTRFFFLSRLQTSTFFL